MFTRVTLRIHGNTESSSVKLNQHLQQKQCNLNWIFHYTKLIIWTNFNCTIDESTANYSTISNFIYESSIHIYSHTLTTHTQWPHTDTTNRKSSSKFNTQSGGAFCIDAPLNEIVYTNIYSEVGGYWVVFVPSIGEMPMRDGRCGGVGRNWLVHLVGWA